MKKIVLLLINAFLAACVISPLEMVEDNILPPNIEEIPKEETPPDVTEPPIANARDAFLENMPQNWIKADSIQWSYPVNSFGGTTDITPRFALFVETNNDKKEDLVYFRITDRSDGFGAQAYGFGMAQSSTNILFNAYIQESILPVPSDVQGEMHIDDYGLYYTDNYGHDGIGSKRMALRRGLERDLPTPTDFRSELLNAVWRGRWDRDSIMLMGYHLPPPVRVSVFEEGDTIKMELKPREYSVNNYIATLTFKNMGTDRAEFDAVLMQPSVGTHYDSDTAIITPTMFYIVGYNTELLFRGKRIIPKNP
ncbi:MAG: hypothetical protein ACRCY4_05300 [Brevinema sp.]